MGQKIITLSGAATDVLYALFFRGALQSGDLPTKSGAAELRELGFAETRHTATEYQRENYFTFLTAEGQEFAIKHLVNTRFGVPAGGYIGSPLDALDKIADLPRYKISSDYAIQKKIADALDTALARRYEQFGNTEPEKTAVVFLEHRWVAIQGGYTPDEMRDAVEYIQRKRKEKADAKAMAESSPFYVVGGVVHIKQSVIQPVNNEESCLSRFISERVSEALREATRPGGIIHAATKR
ncbi:TPA: Fur-regulated protein [Escherichia coli]